EMVDYYRWMGQRTTGVVAVSLPMAQRLRDIGIPGAKITVAPCGVSLPENGLAHPEDNPCRFITVSRLVPKKGVLYLLRAFSEALKDAPGITLDIVGDGPMRADIEGFIRANRMEDTVRMHGQKKHEHVLQMLCRSSVYAQHSITDPATGNAEGLPVGILEASACGLPVVSTFHEGIPEAVEHAVTGFLVKEGDTDMMAEYMVRLANDATLRKEMGLGGRRKIAAGFTEDISLGRLREFMSIGTNRDKAHKCVSEEPSAITESAAACKPCDLPANPRGVRKVLFVNHNIAPYEHSGTPITTMNHALGMKERGLEVAVLIPGQGLREHYKVERVSDITVYKVPRLDKSGTFLNNIDPGIMDQYLRSIQEILREFSPDVVHINDYVYMPARIVECFHDAGCVVVRSVCNDEEICHRDYPVITAGLDSSLCDGPEEAEKCAECFLSSRMKTHNAGIRREVEGKIDERKSFTRHLYESDIDGVIFTEERFKEHFTRFVPVPAEKIRIIPRGFSFAHERVLKAKSAKDEKISFAFVGNIMFSKGIDMVLKAFEILSGLDGFELRIYGTPQEECYVPWLRRLQGQHPGKIFFNGPFRKEDLNRIADETDVCIVPSYFDTYNRVVREMLYCGVPVISTDFFGSSIIREGFNGLKIPIGDHVALAQTMRGIIDNPLLVHSLSEGALNTPIPELSDEINSIRQFYEDLYEKKRLMTPEADEPESSSVLRLTYEKMHGLAGEGDYAGAISLLEQALGSGSGEALIHNDLGVLYYQIGDKEKAFSHYRQAVDIDPLNATFQKNLADYYCVELNRFEDAVKIYMKLLDQDGHDVEVLLSVGHICSALKHFREAAVFYRRVLAIDPKNETARQKIDLLFPFTAEETCPGSPDSAGESSAISVHEEQCTDKESAQGVRAIAFYLPQFHPTSENDTNWGKGFTEWRNVAKAVPYFEGHYQPHLPADLGFYDLRLPEVREEQAAMAAEYGIGGFCYYHYWFHGRRLLNRPLDEVLASGKPDFPFCLCWANENWTRAWDGRQGEILIEQRYSPEDDREHIRWLLNVFRDKRYIRINGRPLMLVYLSQRLPDPARTVRIWREEARKKGEELYLCKVESIAAEYYDPAVFGFDAAVEFQPDWGNLGPCRKKIGNGHIIYEYPEIVDRMIGKPRAAYMRFPCVTPSWDNSPRRKHGALIIANSTPAHYSKWLDSVVKNIDSVTPD
ncbi:MAG TPA: glycoside hydrolase family 99-like domain-containing protein, partial [Thermodesulfovibrionales bacterium]|nr:glycoside hydrolase family 99-like domain-containing protein [Thermodesulfovibrionales bacterium]